MKKYFPLILLVLLFLSQTVSAQDLYNVVFMVAPFAGELNGAPMPYYKYGRMVSGDQITLDLQVMVVTVTAEEDGQHLAFSFDKPLEMVADGVRAEVQKVILEEDQRVSLRTPTMDAGADLEITWNRYQMSPVYRELIQSVTGILNGEPDERYAPYEDYSVMFDIQSALPDGKTLGYTFRDVDGNNVDELLFGEMIEDMTGTPLYDMYTIQNGELVHVFDGWDRNRYYLSGRCLHPSGSRQCVPFLHRILCLREREPAAAAFGDL
ncbi:MAG: hypothetical protein IJI14_05170 [Anaerolineaceae bacterium]|nr:hypothetical protein [Anaerolineaceae bacterium]